MVSPLFFLPVSEIQFKRAARAIKNSVKKGVTATRNKIRTAKIAILRGAKDQLLLLPGISKIKLPEPPFPHLLQSNTHPTDLETIGILNAISTAEAQALRLQEIIQDRGSSSLVEYQLDLAHQFVHAHRGILSAIRRIPPEVLQEIFCQINLHWRNPRQRTILWALSQVCQRWRETALSTPSLWSKNISIHLRQETPRSYVSRINEHLVRSRDAPIEFHLCAFFKDWESHPVIDVLIRHSDRWQTAIINSTSITAFAFKGVKGRLSSLRTLSVEIWDPTDPIVFDAFKDAPQLREVHLHGFLPGHTQLPFSQLTRYKERVRGRGSLGMVDHAISLGTSLTTLEISRCAQSPDIPVTTLPFLVTLKVYFDDFQPYGLFDGLTLPVIQEIWITGYAANFITDIIDMISRSRSCMLKKFALRLSRRNELSSGELTRLLRLTPDLVALDVSLPPLEDLANLIIGRNNQPLVSLLQTLTIEANYGIRQQVMAQLLNAIALSRCRQDSPTSAVPHFPHNRPKLREIRIACVDCYYVLSHLEGWVRSEESEQLGLWKKKLIEELPELVGRITFEERKPDPKLRDRVFNIFSDIQKFHVKDVCDIYISEIHTILRCFTDPETTSILSQFKDKAGEILEKWTPLFESHFPERRWVMKGSSSVVYIPIDDALRSSLTSLDFVYGLNDDDDDEYPDGISWPLYMLWNEFSHCFTTQWC